jgi:hypothetical protein
MNKISHYRQYNNKNNFKNLPHFIYLYPQKFLLSLNLNGAINDFTNIYTKLLINFILNIHQ